MTAQQNQPFDFDLLKTLCELPGIGGREDAVRAFVRERMSTLCDETSVDRLGNVVGIKRGSGGPTVMLAAHMDEIGFLVKHIDDKGFLRLQPVGGFDPRVLPAQRVIVHGFKGDALRGVMATQSKPIHLLAGAELSAPKLDEVFVDIGLSGDEVKEKVEIGDMVVMDRTVERVGNNVIGKAFDDRLCVFAMLEALKALGDRQPNATIVAVATVQEEVGLRGARTSAFNVDPDIGVALDVTLAMDIPGGSEQDTVSKLGEGAAIKIMDSSHISNHKLVQHFRQLARENDIPHQMEVLPRGGTDAGAMVINRGGAPVITLSFPTRYIHTVNEMCAVSDIQAGINLLAAYLEHAHEGDYAFG
ncbi:MAG: M42 family metallopeptidase [Chloroflexota bacterium]|nr:M42 family metallopeptidase [Chloroflexota bacterium]